LIAKADQSLRDSIIEIGRVDPLGMSKEDVDQVDEAQDRAEALAAQEENKRQKKALDKEINRVRKELGKAIGQAPRSDYVKDVSALISGASRYFANNSGEMKDYAEKVRFLSQAEREGYESKIKRDLVEPGVINKGDIVHVRPDGTIAQGPRPAGTDWAERKATKKDIAKAAKAPELLGITDIGDNYHISIYKGANLSTAVHELGHSFLWEMQQAAEAGIAHEQLRSDWQAINDWLGAEGQTITREQHEKFARGFEQYLREGNAPTSKLAQAFERFRNWLVRIYKTARSLDVELDDTVRAVFDRMVSGELEVENASATLELIEKTSKQLEEAGVTEQDREEINELLEQGKLDAVQSMHEQRNKSFRKRIKAWREEAENEVDASPLYKSMIWLHENGGLNRWWVLNSRGKNALSALNKRRLTAREGNDDPDAVDETPLTAEEEAMLTSADMDFDIASIEAMESGETLFGDMVEFLPKSEIRSRDGIPYAPGDVETIMNAVDDLGGIKVKSKAPIDGLGEYDDMPALHRAGIYNRVMKQDGHAPDIMAAILKDERGIGDGSVVEMWKAIADDLASRRHDAAERKKQKQIEQREKLDFGWLPDDIADKFGFADGDELIDSLVSALPRKERIAQLVQGRIDASDEMV
jgi:hypothetical protein